MAATAVTPPASSSGIERDERNNGSRWDKASINGSSGRGGLTLSTSLSTPTAAAAAAAATATTVTGDGGSSSTSFSSASSSSSSSTKAAKPSRCRHHSKCNHHRRGANNHRHGRNRHRHHEEEKGERRQEEDEEEEEEENHLLLQQQTGYVTTYPKLQLVKIDDNWYALNQTCLQIYQQLQMCGTAQLMPVDVVPLNKLPECVRKSLSSPDGESSRNKRSSSSANGMKQQQQTGRSRPMNANNGDVVGGGALRIYDVMSDSAGTSAAATSADVGSGTTNGASTLFMPRSRGHQPQATQSGTSDDKSSPSWWWRFLPVVSCRRQSTSSRVQQQQQQIVQQLVEETLRQPILTPPLSSLTKNGSCGSGLQQPLDSTDSDGAAYVYVCVICSSTYPSHRLLQRHRDRANHYGCSICSKSFKSFSTLQDHCELLSHYSDDSSEDDDSDEELSEDECLFSSETCSSGGEDNFHEADD